MKKCTKFSAVLAASLMGLVSFPAVQAQEVYTGIGLFGAQLGYAYALSPSLTLRGDLMTLGSRNQTTNESGTQYQARLKASRQALLADWFPFESGTFRLTGGATFNQVALELAAGGANTSVDINNTKYNLAASDSINIRIKMPSSTPYLGLGWGHKQGGKGWGFHADLGVSIGQFKVTETRTGGLVNGGVLGVTQADIDKELTPVRDDVAKVKALPQATVGVSYRF